MIDPNLTPTRLLSQQERGHLPIRGIERPTFLWPFVMTSVFVRWFWRVFYQKLTGRLPRQLYARELRLLFERLGGLWIKAGQLLSLRRDIFSSEFCNELSQLQDQAWGFSPAEARRIIEEDLGRPLDYYFDKFDEAPIAAASIGQIHRAHLRHERLWVAIKVQRPNVPWKFHTQLKSFRFITWFMEAFRILPYLRPRELLWELEQIAQEELDYRMEASNIRRMRKVLKRHKILAPKVLLRYCRARLLVTEFVHAALMADFLRMENAQPERLKVWLKENNIDTRKVGRRLYHSFLRQIFEDNLFHGDLHPGNIILLRDSNIALIDFGSVGSMESEWQKKYSLFLRSLATKEYSKAIDLVFLLCASLPHIDTQLVKERVVRIFRAWELRAATKSLPYHEKSITSMFQELVVTLFEFKISSTWQLMKVDRAGVTLDASLAHLFPDANYPKLLRSYFRDAERRELELGEKKSSRRHALRGMMTMAKVVPDLLFEYRMFQGPVLRRHAQMYQGSLSKVAFLMSTIFARTAQAIFLCWVMLVLVFVQKFHPAVLQRWDVRWISRAAAFFPEMSYTPWVLALLATAYVYYTAAMVQTRFATREARLPNENRQ